MSDYLVRFGVGGVQEFIAQARKMRDFAAGSALISGVSRHLATRATETGGTLALPPDPPKDGEPWPQAFNVYVELADDIAIAEWCESIRSFAREKWASMLFSAYCSLFNEMSSGEQRHDTAAAEQIDSALQIYWVAIPTCGDPKKDSRVISEAYEDRRRTRTFRPTVTTGQGWPMTCSACGTRESLLQPPREGWPETKTILAKRERLCTVCAARRQWSRDKLEHIPSTHRFARHRFFVDERFSTLRSQYDVKTWEAMFDRWDELEAGKRQTPKTGNCPSGSKPNRKPYSAYRALVDRQDLYNAIQQLSPYYAIIVLDGDNIGRWLSGESFRDDVSFPDAQAAISRSMLNFARGIVESFRQEPTPRPVEVLYLGGDDGVLFASIDSLFHAIRVIHESWVSSFKEMDQFTRDGIRPTLSLHASIVHAKAPLQPALTDAFASLHNAKHKTDRNCVSLLCDVHSGVPISFFARWEELEHLESSARLFTGSPDNASGGSGPTRILHTLQDAMQPFINENDAVGVEHVFFERELARLVDRTELGSMQKAECDGFIRWLSDRARRRHGEITGGERFRSALQSTAFLARQFRKNEGLS